MRILGKQLASQIISFERQLRAIPPMTDSQKADALNAVIRTLKSVFHLQTPAHGFKSVGEAISWKPSVHTIHTERDTYTEETLSASSETIYDMMEDDIKKHGFRAASDFFFNKRLTDAEFDLFSYVMGCHKKQLVIEL